MVSLVIKTYKKCTLNHYEKMLKYIFLLLTFRGLKFILERSCHFHYMIIKIIDECACLAHNLVCCMSLKINRIIKVHIAAKNKLISLETNKIKGKTALFKLHKTCLHF